jgi:hypothetical protein
VGNDDAAEKSAQTTAAVINSSPLVTMSLSDPDALSNVNRRISTETSRRGRNALKIPLASSAGRSGIAIPL